ncbi:MAG TPA: glycoside hydrolase [Armatimonadota bacterium]|nr:glycoside hydrolase [Armatimonadota bacterium]
MLKKPATGRIVRMTAGVCLGVLLLGASRSRAATVSQNGGGWTVRNTRLLVTLDPTTGQITVLDRASGFEWRQPDVTPPATPRFRQVHAIPNGIAFTGDFGATNGHPNMVDVSLSLPDADSDMDVTADMANRTTPISNFFFLPPFVLDSPGGVLAVADYCDGHLYPLDYKPFPRTWFDGGRLDMPWVGVCDLNRGNGYALILETSDDAVVRCVPHSTPRGDVMAPQVGWMPSMKVFRYPRRLRYHFVSSGGYVALAKAYRAYAKTQGLIVPFSQKLKRNPNIRRLFGAPDVWGDASLKFAREAKAAGVEKMLIHGRTTPAEMKAIDALGYLTSEYDNYTDVLPLKPGQPPDSNHELLPAHAVLKADGTRMTAWQTYDNKIQYMKRCPSFWVPTAKIVIPKVLKTWPFLGRFIDVTTAEGLYECYDPNHPLTRTQKRECGEDLIHYVDSEHLVAGGEHGIWWAAPYEDYIEGMMSGNRFAWPAGYLIHPSSREEKFTGPHGSESWETYDRWSMGQQWRAPLWELVFHDCVVSTWYWGDSSDWLLKADPAVTAKKDAFNILYGTIPLLWADADGSWKSARSVFMRTYRDTCRLHEAIAGTEMLSHEFLTPDHDVQRTRFSDGTTCVVNFGSKPAAVEIAKKKYLLPQNGFAVSGPHIQQSDALVNGHAVTSIRQAGYYFSDAGGSNLTVRSAGPGRLRLDADSNRNSITFQPSSAAPGWDLASTRVFLLDSQGRRIENLPFHRAAGGFIEIAQKGGAFEIVSGAQAHAPDLQIEPADIVVASTKLRQGEKTSVRVTVNNAGGSAVRNVRVSLFADTMQAANRIGDHTISLAPGRSKTLTFIVDTSRMDGRRQLIASASPSPAIIELCDRNNAAARDIQVAADFRRWPVRRWLRVGAGPVDRENGTAVLILPHFTGDPASVRVASCDKMGRPLAMVPAQLDRVGSGRSALYFQIPGTLAAGSTRRFLLLYAPAGGARFLRPAGSIWNSDTSTITATTYHARFINGTLVDVGAAKGNPFLSRLMYSSAQTGWSEEPGKVERFEVLSSGPVRTVIRVRKALNAGVIYDKTYTFYPDHYELSGSVNKPVGVFDRAYYERPGTYEDSGGAHAQVDGKGDDEGVSGRSKNPAWFAVYTGDWAEAGIALSTMSGITYWDTGGAWGGIGFDTSAAKGIRIAYWFQSGAPDAGFAVKDSERLGTPITVAIEPGGIEAPLAHVPGPSLAAASTD